MIFACVGRRDLQIWENDYLQSAGAWLGSKGHCMTSGNASGADQAFHIGFCMEDIHCERSELYLPWRSFESRSLAHEQIIYTSDQATPEHRRLAEQNHSYWDVLSSGAKSMMIRNAMMIARFNRPVDCVWAWPNMEKPGYGGTGHTMRIATSLGIPVLLLNTWKWLSPPRQDFSALRKALAGVWSWA